MTEWWRGFLTCAAIPVGAAAFLGVLLAIEFACSATLKALMAREKRQPWYTEHHRENFFFWFRCVRLDRERQWEWSLGEVCNRVDFLGLIRYLLVTWRPFALLLFRRWERRYGTEDAPKSYPAYATDTWGDVIKK